MVGPVVPVAAPVDPVLPDEDAPPPVSPDEPFAAAPEPLAPVAPVSDEAPWLEPEVPLPVPVLLALPRLSLPPPQAASSRHNDIAVMFLDESRTMEHGCFQVSSLIDIFDIFYAEQCFMMPDGDA